MIDPVELVIFDCDGVLVDSEPIAARVNVRLGAELGWPLGEEEVVERFMGRSAASIHAEIVAHIGEEKAALWEERFQRLHHEAMDAGLAAVPGIAEALGAIEAAGLPTCVASSGTHEKMRHTLGITGLYDRFEGRIFSATEVAHGKPAPDLFLHAAAAMGVAPGACVVVEDSTYGVRAARSAGMRSFGYAGGLIPVQQLEGPGTVVFDDMRKLPALVNGA